MGNIKETNAFFLHSSIVFYQTVLSSLSTFPLSSLVHVSCYRGAGNHGAALDAPRLHRAGAGVEAGAGGPLRPCARLAGREREQEGEGAGAGGGGEP